MTNGTIVCMLYIGGSPWLELDMVGPEVILFYFIFM